MAKHSKINPDPAGGKSQKILNISELEKEKLQGKELLQNLDHLLTGFCLSTSSEQLYHKLNSSNQNIGIANTITDHTANTEHCHQP